MIDKVIKVLKILQFNFFVIEVSPIGKLIHSIYFFYLVSFFLLGKHMKDVNEIVSLISIAIFAIESKAGRFKIKVSTKKNSKANVLLGEILNRP